MSSLALGAASERSLRTEHGSIELDDSLPPALRDVLKQFDVEGDGTVSLKTIYHCAKYSKGNPKRRANRQSLSKLQIDLKKVPDPATRDALGLFDFDGNGVIDGRELCQASEAERMLQKSRKYMIYALIGAVILACLITGALSIAIYYIVGSNKDTSIDASTGAMSVKNNAGVPVNIEAHGKTFAPDLMDDPETGLPLSCITSNDAVSMFNSVVDGTKGKFVEKDEMSGSVSVKGIGISSSGDADFTTWTEDTVFLGDIVLVPSAECSNAYAAENRRVLYPDDDGSGYGEEVRRKLSEEELVESNRSLRDRAVESLKSGENVFENINKPFDHDKREEIFQWFNNQKS